MARHIQLIDKTTNEPEIFTVIDEKLCKALNVPVDPNHWVHRWYDVICFRLSFGSSVPKLRRELVEDNMVELSFILNYIEEYYNIDVWG